jgi:hypothetical protein
LALGATLCLAMGGVSSASAAKVSVPGKPTIVLIQSKKTKGTLYQLTATVEKPLVTGGSPVTSVIISLSGSHAGKSCTIRGKASACTIRNISLKKVTSQTVIRVAALAVNKKGKGKQTSQFHLISNNLWVAVGYKPDGKKFPSADYRPQSSRVLSGSSTKWKKFQGINRNSVTSASVVKQARPQVGNPSVIFNITGTVGIALPENIANATQSGMFAVRSDGTTVDSLIAGSLQATISDFYSAPNGRFYVTFTTRTLLEQGGPLCSLAEVNSTTGVASCVDSTIESVALTLMMSDSAPIQFDGLGNIYYTGRANGKFVLRKSVNSIVSNIINDNISLNAFVVLPDGSVIIKGQTNSQSSTWLRRLSANGELLNLVPQNTSTGFLSVFPDGNVYFGIDQSIKRYLTSSQTVDSQDWVSFGRLSTTSPLHNFPSCGLKYSGCPSLGMNKLYKTSANQVLGLTGFFGNTNNGLAILYPKPEVVMSVLTRISLVYQVGSKLVLTGIDASGTNMLTVYDPTTYQETVIIDKTNETEVYSIAYISQTGKILFNGLKFSNNSLVVGEVDLP